LNARPLRLFSLAVTGALLFALGRALSSQSAGAPSLTVLAKDGRRGIPIAIVGGQDFVGLDDLAQYFKFTIREEPIAITVTYNAKPILLTPDQAIVQVAGRLIALPAPPSRSGRRWLVPVDFISRALASVSDTKLDLRKPSRLLVVGDLRVPRVTVRYDALGASGRLTIDTTPRAASTATQDNNRVTIKFDVDQLDMPAQPLPAQSPQSLVQSVRLADPTTIVVDLGPRIGTVRTSTQPVDTTARLTIDIVSAPSETTPAAAPPPTAVPSPPPPALPQAQPLTELPPGFGAATPSPIRTIALDPGHGGDDDGVRSAGGAKEKDLALAVARKLRTAFETRLGVRVLLTRDDDRNTPIDDRAAIANNNKADLFLSLHANASLRRSTSGAEIFVALFDREAAAAAVLGATDRVTTFGGGSRDIELVLWDSAQVRHVERSLNFAGILESTLRDRVPLAAQPVERAPLRVLESANMPAVLVEMGYLSNAEQERQLTSDAFQSTFVQAIFDAVQRFRDALSLGVLR